MKEKRAFDDVSPSRYQAIVSSPYLFVFVAVLLWSTGGVFIKLTSAGAFTVNFGRSLFAAITVAVYLRYRNALRFEAFSLIAGVFYAATLTAFVYANKHTTAANAIFLQYTAPIYILIFAPLILKDRFRLFDVFTVALCLAGMSLLVLDPGTADMKSSGDFAGIVAGLISGACLGMYFVMLRHPRALRQEPSLSVLTGNLIIVVAMLPFLEWTDLNPTSGDLLAIAYLGIVQIGIAYILFTSGVARGVRSLDASIIGFIEPLLNPIWVVLFVSEIPSKWTISGGIIILTAVLIHTFKMGYSKRKMIPSEPL